MIEDQRFLTRNVIGKSKDIDQYIDINILKDNSKNYWISSLNTLLLFNAEGMLLKRFSSQISEITESNWSVQNIFEDNKHRIWAGTTVGLILIE